jgi:hypothetical protein
MRGFTDQFRFRGGSQNRKVVARLKRAPPRRTAAQWGIVLLVLLAAYSPLPAADDPPVDPLPLRRLLISPERLPFELQQARQGTLIQMSRTDFEARVAEAAQAGAAVKNPPRLVEAHYHARLVDAALRGTGEWTVVNPNATAGILLLQAFDLALRQARLDKSDAILGDVEGKSLGLVVERCGKHVLSFAWSARGEMVPGGLRFQLRVPSCVLTSFDLECPADRTITLVGDNGLLSGPLPASAPDQRIWRLQCGGYSPVDLLVRQTPAASESAPLVLARLRTQQKLAPDLLEADYDFSVEVLHGSIRELVCEGDPTLRPTAVTIGSAEVESWEVQPGPAADAPFRLVIRLPERFPENPLPLRIQCLAPVMPKRRWTSPGLRLRGAIFQGETLELHLSPEVQLEDWRPGSFELTKGVPEAAGKQWLTLQSGLGEEPRVSNAKPAASGPPHLLRPSARLRVPAAEYRARQVAWWHVGPDATSLTVEIDYEVVHGRLFRLPLLLPANWSLTRVDVEPPDLVRKQSPIPAERGQTQLIVDLQQPLEAPSTARLTLQFRPTNPWPLFSHNQRVRSAEFAVPFPEVVPPGARLWDAALALRIDPLYEATVRASLPATPLDRKIEESRSALEERPDRLSLALHPLGSLLRTPPPWGVQPPDYLYTGRGRAVRGSVILHPRPPRLRAHCTSEVVLAATRAAVSTRLLLQPEVGNPDTVDLLVSAPVAANWTWRSKTGSNGVKEIQRLRTAEVLPWLLPLGGGTPLTVLGPLHPLLHQATRWRLTLAGPLREPLLLETTFQLVSEGPPRETLSALTPLAATTILEWLTLATVRSESKPEPTEENHWQVPLITVLSAEPMDGEVQLYVEGTGVVQPEPEGLAEVTPPSGSGGSSRWGTYRYSRLPVALALHGHIAAMDRSAAVRIEHAHLTTYVEPAGRLLNYYSFQVRNWEQGTLPLRLPTGAQVLAAKVDGRWIALPSLHETTETGFEPRLQPAKAGTPTNAPVIELPIATKAAALCFEVVYALKYSAGTLWSQVQAPLPVLPRAAVASRHTWCLPAGFLPLHEGVFQRHPGPDAEFSPGSAANFISLAALVNPAGTFARADWRRRQERLLAEADAHLQARQREHKDRTLGAALHYLTYEFFKSQEILAIDAVALREAGLHPATPLPVEAQSTKPQSIGLESETLLRPLDSLGLVCLPCRPAPLLTTNRQWAAWQTRLDPTQALSDSITTALAEVVAYGHDRSGRFWSAAEWLRNGDTPSRIPPGEENGSAPPSPPPSQGGDGEVRGLFTALPHPDAWTEWEPIAGLPGAETVVVVRHDALWGLTASLASVLLLGWWWVRQRQERLGYRLFLIWVAVSVVGLLWLPPGLCAVCCWPMLIGIGLAAAWYLVSAFTPRVAMPANPPSAAAIAVLAMALAAGLPGQAAAPRPYTVWLLPGPANAPEKLSTLVPPELLNQLQALAHRGVAGLTGAIFQSARYEGTIANGSADLQAEFQVYCFTPEGSTLSIPIGGVELREAFLDGNAAYPTALLPPQNGYALRLRGRGVHTLRMHFAVRIPTAGEDRDLRFTIPEVVQSQLSLIAPEGARYLQVVFGRGAQRISPDPQGVRVEADLGRISTLQVHWRQELPQRPPAAVQAKEAYYWDIEASGSRLLGLLDYTILRGAVTELTTRLPDSLEVRRVELTSAGGGSLVPRLKDWTVAGPVARRHLRLEFQGPVTNEVQVLLELVPRQPLGRGALLALPTPEGVSFGEGLLAYRIRGFQGTVAKQRGVTRIEPKLFERSWQPAEIEYPGTPDQAYRLLRGPGDGVSLQLNLQAPVLQRECVQELTWYVDPQQAALRAHAMLTAPQMDLMFVEWEIPVAVTVADVGGPDVRSWSRTGSRLQIWLQRSVAETTLELTGWTAPRSRQPGMPFTLPCLAFPTAAHTTRVRLVAEHGWALETKQLRNLEALSDPPPAEDDRSYVSKQAAYGGIFHLRPATTHVDVHTVSVVEVGDRRVAFRATLDYETSRRPTRSRTVRVRNWKGQELRLETRPALRHRESHGDPQVRTWTLELPPNFNSRIRIQLTGSLTLDGNADAVMPAVSVDEATASDQWLAVIGAGLRIEEQHGLSAASDTSQALSHWPAEAESLRRQGGSVWKTDASDWKLLVRADLPSVESSPVRLFLDEQAAAIVDGRRWLHQATYWLYQESGTYLGIRLPSEATLTRAVLDGSDITPLQTASELHWLPLTGGSGLRLLRLRWVYHTNRERLDSPCLETPRLENVLYPPAEQRSPILWTLHIPPGYHVAHAEGKELPGGPVERYVCHAAARLLAARVLADSSAGKSDETLNRQLQLAQDRFHHAYQEAEYELQFAQRLRDQGLRLAKLAVRLQHLQADNEQLAKAHGLAVARTSATASNDDAPLTQQGTPTYWQTGDDGREPQVRLVAIETVQIREALGYSGLLLLLFVIAWLLPSYPRALAWVQMFWPEEIALLGGLSWLVRGGHWAFLLLLLLGVVARLMYLGRWVGRYLRQPATATGGTSAT